MGDNVNMIIDITKRPKCSKSIISMKKESSMNMEDTLSTCICIINNILTYTNTLEPHQSTFDIFTKQGSDTDSDSDSDDYSDIEHYMAKCINYLGINQNLLILSMMTLDKLLGNNPEFILCEKNVHKVIFLCLMETQKFNDDETFTNKDYAKVGDINVNELLTLEREFLSLIQFNLFISLEAFLKYKLKLTQFWKMI